MGFDLNQITRTDHNMPQGWTTCIVSVISAGIVPSATGRMLHVLFGPGGNTHPRLLMERAGLRLNIDDVGELPSFT
jgi:hypothetical protein